MEKVINLDKMSIVEIKALCFDLEQEMREREQNYQRVVAVLQQRLNDEEKSEKGKG